ncbi:hypothetical protein [Microcoleus sp. MON2_D5]|uniref:hypothetical protein n=1 Tax=Microcoleus sp. MON2_D5 TaxID=2818833 RepID=UPI002FD26030
MGSTTRQLKEQDRELLKFHERVGDLWIKVQSLKEQLEVERSDRKDIEAKYWDKVEALTELQLRAVDADQGEVRSTVSQQKRVTASKDLPDAAAILQEIRKNQEKQEEQDRKEGKRKKPKSQKVWTLKDIEETLEAIASAMIKES